MNQKGLIWILTPIIVLICGIVVATYLSQKPQTFKPKAAAAPSGTIVTSGKMLVDSSTNREFIVRSVQYMKVHPNYVGTFNADNFDGNYVDEHFTWMQILGFNTVRLIYHNYADGEAKLSSSATLCREDNQADIFTTCHDITSVNNLAKTVDIARNHNLRIILTMYGGVPFRYATKLGQLNYTENSLYTDPQTVRDYSRYLKDFLEYLKTKTDLSTILAVQPQAEPWLYRNQFPLQAGNELHPIEFTVSSPFPITDNVLTKTNGKNSEVMNQILQESLTFSFNSWFDAIKSVEPTLLTGYDQFPSYAVPNADTRHVYDYQLINPNLRADIIGMQVYRYVPISIPGNSKQALDMIFDFYPGFKNALSDYPKPFIMWEYGYDNANLGQPNPNILGSGITSKEEFLKDWMRASCSLNPAGWNLFFWRHANSLDAGFEPIDTNNFALARAVSPGTFSDPCLRQSPSAAPSISPSPSSNPSPSDSAKPGDTDNDNDVDIFDYNIVVTDFGKTNDPNTKADLDNDNDVDIFDYNLVVSNFGK